MGPGNADWMSGLSGLIGGTFGNSGAPYEAARNEYEKYGAKGEEAQNPFYKAGTGAIGNYQDWLSKMKDPTEFLNSTMGKYQESPWAQYQQNEAIRAANNLGSASGLTGSTPLQKQAQQNARNISSEDMGSWLQKVLGINTQYGQGQQNLIGGGKNAANALTQLFSNLGGQNGQAVYGQQAGQNQDFMNQIGGMLQLAALFL